MSSRAPRSDPDECSRAACGRDPEVSLTWADDEEREYCEAHAQELAETYPDRVQEDVDEEVLERENV